jgi:hypothetical protein
LKRPEGDDTEEGVRKAYNSMSEALAEIRQLERRRAQIQQDEAGITKPLKPGFKPTGDPELDAALAKLWESGKYSKELYIQINKGLAAFDRRRLLDLVQWSPAAIEDLAKAEILNSRI